MFILKYHFIMEMWSCGAAARADLSHLRTDLHPVTGLYKNLAHVGITRLDPELVLDLDQQAIARLRAGVDHDTVGGGVDRRAVRCREVGAFVHPAPTLAEARGKAERVLDRNRERGLFQCDPVQVHPVQLGQDGIGANAVGVRHFILGREGQRRQRAALARIAAANGVEDRIRRQAGGREDAVQRFQRDRYGVLKLSEDPVVAFLGKATFEFHFGNSRLRFGGDHRHRVAFDGGVVKRGGQEYKMTFRDGVPIAPLKSVGKIGARNSGTTVRFWPDPVFFDSAGISVSRLKRLLRAKAVLCPGLRIDFRDEDNARNSETWEYEDGIRDYLLGEIGVAELVPTEPFVGHFKGNDQEADWAVTWTVNGSSVITESYVNLIPTTHGGSHVNGFRSGLTEAVREFCEFRDLLPRGVKLAPEDVWNRCCYLLAVRMKDPQFSGQAKERLSSRDSSVFVMGVAKDAFSLWMNQHTAEAERIAALAIENAQSRIRAGKKVARKAIASGPALPGKLADCMAQDLERTELFLVEGDSAGGSAKQARNKDYQAVMPLKGKILNTWEVDPAEVLGSCRGESLHDERNRLLVTQITASANNRRIST